MLTWAIFVIVLFFALILIDRLDYKVYGGRIGVNDYVEIVGSDVQGMVTSMFNPPFDSTTYYVVELSHANSSKVYPYHGYTRVYSRKQVMKVQLSPNYFECCDDI